MPSEVMLSIITVTRNDLFRLRKTAESIKRQFPFDCEWIIVDGNSEDGTIDSILSKDFDELRINFSSHTPNGIYDAMNIGVRRAKGKYVIFLNAGDTLLSPESGKKMEQIIRTAKHKNKSIATPVLQITKGFLPYCLSIPRVVKIGPYTIAEINHQGAILRREIVLEIGLFDTTLKYAADGKLLDEIAARNDFLIADSPLVGFELEGVSSRNFLETMAEICSYRPIQFSDWELFELRCRNRLKLTILKFERRLWAKKFFTRFVSRKFQKNSNSYLCSDMSGFNPFDWPH